MTKQEIISETIKILESDNGDLTINLPEELLNNMGWKADDELKILLTELGVRRELSLRNLTKERDDLSKPFTFLMDGDEIQSKVPEKLIITDQDGDLLLECEFGDEYHKLLLEVGLNKILKDAVEINKEYVEYWKGK